MPLKKRIINNLNSIPGWHTNRKLLVIESDDWGSIRMPSKEVYDELFKTGLRVDRCKFSQYDGLESSTDLAALFEVLTSVKDKYGRNAVFTANSVVANPDFDKIKALNFQEYQYEPFTETLKKYSSQHHNAFDLWKEGMSNKIFHPQFHGREHLNVLRWMKALQENDPITMRSFNQRHFGLSNLVTPELKVRYMDAFGNVGSNTLEQEKQIIKEGILLFEEIFGYRSKSFIAPCYIWRPEIEPFLKENGIDYLQGLPLQQIPVLSEPILKVRTVYHYLGQKNISNQRYLIRNCFFEPYINDGINWVNECMSRIQIAFRWGKPAVISSHRINFIGNTVPAHRDANLTLLKFLLKEIVKKWPDIEFLTSDQLGNIISD